MKKMVTVQQLIAELEERDLDIPIVLEDGRNIVDIDYTDDGQLMLIGENDVSG